MKRRGFLKLLSFAPAVAAVPALAASKRAVGMVPELGMAYERPMTALEILVRRGTRFYYRPDTTYWYGYCVVGDAVVQGQQYEYATQYMDEPAQWQREVFHEQALLAMQRAQRKYG